MLPGNTREKGELRKIKDWEIQMGPGGGTRMALVLITTLEIASQKGDIMQEVRPPTIKTLVNIDQDNR